MTNAQLFQKFASDRLFEKTYRVSLSHLLTFVDLHQKLTSDEIEELAYVIKKVEEWRTMQKEITTTVIK